MHRFGLTVTVSDIGTALAEHPLDARLLVLRAVVDLLRRFRDDDELVVRGIQLSINASATGLQNSG